MREVGREVIGIVAGGAEGADCNEPFGGSMEGMRGLGDAGMVGKLIGLPLLVLRRWCDDRVGLATSSGRGGRTVDGGSVGGGANEKRPGRNVNDSRNDVFVAGAE